MTVSDFRKSGAPDAVGLHTAAKKLILQRLPLVLGRPDLCSGRGFAQLLALPGGPFGCAVKTTLLSQDAMLQVGAQFAHRLAQPGHE